MSADCGSYCVLSALLAEWDLVGVGDERKFPNRVIRRALPVASGGLYRGAGALAVSPTIYRLAPARQKTLLQEEASANGQEEARHGDDDPHRERAHSCHRHPEDGPG